MSQWLHSGKYAVTAGTLWVIISGAFAGLLLPYILTMSSSTSKGLLSIIPPFGLYAGLFELSQHSFTAAYADTDGLSIYSLFESSSAGNISTVLRSVLITFSVEAPIFLAIACLGIRGSSNLWGQRLFHKQRIRRSNVSHHHSVAMADVIAEEKKAAALFDAANPDAGSGFGIVMYQMRKVFGSFCGERIVACASLSLCIDSGECFGLLGPNGAGKTTALHMMIGLIPKSSGKATVAGCDIDKQMTDVRRFIGVCLQHDCLWASLTGVHRNLKWKQHY